MTLAPNVRALIDAMSAVFPPLDTTLTGTEVRAAIKVAGAKVIPVEPEPVAGVSEIQVPVDGASVTVRLYRPQTPLGDRPPLVAFFHGGGFVVCDLDSHDDLCRSLTNASGCVLASVDYRLAPEHRYPTGVEDCYAATIWLVEHADELGVDPGRVAVAGDSAGGNLAAVVALMSAARGTPSLALQLLVYPMLDHRCDTGSHRTTGEGYFLRSEEVQWYWGEYLADPAQGREPYASPSVLDTAPGVAPAVVVTAEFDPLRDEGEAYAEMLRRSGVKVHTRRYDGMFHSFWSFLTALDEAPKVSRYLGGHLERVFADTGASPTAEPTADPTARGTDEP